MDPVSTSTSAISAQSQAMVRQELGVRVFRAALDAESSSALQLIQAMAQSSGLGTAVDQRV